MRLPDRLPTFSPLSTIKQLATLAPSEKKVRSFVGQFLVGSSILSTSASLVFAVVISPAWVIMVIPSIAFGALGVNFSSQAKNNWVPLGIENPKIIVEDPKDPTKKESKQTSCWINSAFQFFTNIPSFQEIIEKKKEVMKPLCDFIQIYQDQQAKGAKAFALNLLSLWAWLYDQTKQKQAQLESRDGSQHEDPAIFFRFILDECSSGLPMQRTIYRYKDGVSIGSSEPTDVSNEERYISIEVQGQASFQSALTAYFKNTIRETDKDNKETGVVIENVKSFTKAPEEFTLFLNRTTVDGKGFKDENGIRLTKSLDIPVELTLTKEQSPNETATYVLDGAIKHIGSSIIKEGHYISYVLKNGVWYEMNDISRTELTPAQLKKAIRKEGVIFHFTKKSEALPQLAALARA